MKSNSSISIYVINILIIMCLFSQSLCGETINYIKPPPNYTKLDKYGHDLPDTATKWSMVRDNIHGLIWEAKTDDGSIHDMNNRYLWSDTNSASSEKISGIPGNITDTKGFISLLNSTQFGGFSDWRIPNVDNFQSIIKETNFFYFTIDSFYFPNTLTSYYWSYSSSTTDDAKKILLSLSKQDYSEYIIAHQNSNPPSPIIRAVRGNQSQLLNNLNILAPELADRWNVDTYKTIAWTPKEITGNVRISLSRQGGKEGTYEIIADNTPNDGSYEWKVNGPESFNCFLTI